MTGVLCILHCSITLLVYDILRRYTLHSVITLKSALQVIVVDEISSIEEVQAIISIAQRGAIVVASAPEPSLKCLIGNPEVNALLGRSQHVACGDMHTKWVIIKSCMWLFSRHDLHP